MLQKSVNLDVIPECIFRTYVSLEERSKLPFRYPNGSFPIVSALVSPNSSFTCSISPLLSPSVPLRFTFRKNSTVQFFSLFVLWGLPERCFQPRIYHPRYNRLVKGSPLSALHFVLLIFFLPFPPSSFTSSFLFFFSLRLYFFFYNKLSFRSILPKNRISFSPSYGSKYKAMI